MCMCERVRVREHTPVSVMFMHAYVCLHTCKWRVGGVGGAAWSEPHPGCPAGPGRQEFWKEGREGVPSPGRAAGQRGRERLGQREVR